MIKFSQRRHVTQLRYEMYILWYSLLFFIIISTLSVFFTIKDWRIDHFCRMWCTLMYIITGQKEQICWEAQFVGLIILICYLWPAFNLLKLYFWVPLQYINTPSQYMWRSFVSFSRFRFGLVFLCTLYMVTHGSAVWWWSTIFISININLYWP